MGIPQCPVQLSETQTFHYSHYEQIGFRKKCLTRPGGPSVCRGTLLITKMLALVPVRAELATAPALGQAREAAGQARVWGWAEHPVRQRLVQVRVTCAPT